MNYCAWQVKQPDERAAARLAGEIGAPLLLARILVARGIKDPAEAMQLLTQDAPLADPFLMRDMEKAAERILRAVDAEEPIVIFGDYDVDGITATALLYSHLRGMGANVRCKLPSRADDGYGLSEKIVRDLAEKGFKLLVTVDNGVTAVQEAALCRELGMDLVVTDHHLPAAELPDAVAVVDPNRADDESPFKALSGAGVAFKLCAALDGCAPEDILEFCGDLAAMGTVADVMPLVGENRTIVKHGLELLRNCDRPGLTALMEVCGLGERPITADNISFALGPRLNAAGRMGSASTALRLLLCEDWELGEELAQKLSDINAARQEAEQQIMAEVEKLLAKDASIKNDRVMVVWGQDFHPGVIGIVASRLLEQYHKPVIVISVQNGEGKGSGRSVKGFNLHKALTACAPLLIRAGGHAMAAGLSVTEENIPALRKALNEYAASEYPVPAIPCVEMDVEVRLEKVNVEEVQSLDYLAPCGAGNPAPLFLVRDAMVEAIYPVSDGRHTRLRLRQGAGSLYATCFGQAPEKFAYPVGSHVDVALSLSVYEGRNGPQISGRVRELRPAGLENCSPQQAAVYTAFRQGASLEREEKLQLLPDRAHVAAIYRMIRSGGVSAEDLQPLFARMGSQLTGKTMAALDALLQLGLVEIREIGGAETFVPVAVEGKKDLESAPVLKALKE